MKRVAFATSLLIAACGTDVVDHGRSAAGSGPDGGASDGGVEVSATIAGGSIPASAKVIVVWQAGHEGQALRYKWGEGPSTGASFSVRLPTPPPTAALASGTTGIAILFLIPSDAVFADGVVDDSALRASVVGASTQHAIVYVGPGAVFPAWVSSFAPGYACGGPREVAEGFAPAQCSTVRIDIGAYDSLIFVDWH